MLNAAMSMHATIMHFAICLPDWNSLDSVRRTHSDLAGAALVFFALLVVCEALAHLSDDKKTERRFDKMGIIFFAIAVLAEIAAYPYGQRNDTLSEQVIRSLDATARDASSNASTALSNSKEAETKSTDAVDKAGKALDKSNSANASASKALNTSKAATDAASEAQEKIGAVAERADDLDRAIWQTQYLISARSLRNRELLIATLRKFNKKKVLLKSFIGDAEGWDLCNSLFNAAYNAEMDPVNNCGKEYFSPPLLTGILIFGSTKQEIEEFSNIMADAVDPGGASGMRPEPGSTLTIRVGIKPPYFRDKAHVFKPPTKRQTTKPNTRP